VTKKLVGELSDIDAAIIVCNACDPQLATLSMFYSAIEGLSHFTVLNKTDTISKERILELTEELPGEVIPASLIQGRGLPEIEFRLKQWVNADRVGVLGVFNCLSGDTEIIAKKVPSQHGYARYPLRELAEKKTYKNTPRSILLLSYNPVADEVVTNIAKIVRTGYKEIHRITLEDGRTIEPSQDHRFFTNVGGKLEEVRVGNLKVGDSIITEDESVITAWLDWSSEKRGKGAFTKGARLQQQKRGRKRFLADNPSSNKGYVAKATVTRRSNLAYMAGLREHMRRIQPLSPKGSYRKGKTLAECYGEERSDEIKRKLSIAFSGSRNPSYGKIFYPKPYYVGELDHSVRSSWEEEVCKTLARNKVCYEYEPERIRLVVGGKSLTYTPDIKLQNGCYIEVKGAIYDWQVEKLKAFVATGRQLILVTANRPSIREKVQLACTHHISYGDTANLLSLTQCPTGDCIHPVRITHIELIGVKDTYDINVPKYGNFFLANGILSHNSGKTSLINALTNENNPVDDIPGTTLVFSEHKYNHLILLDSVGQIIDVSKPLMVSIDLSNCVTDSDKVLACFDGCLDALQATRSSVASSILEAVDMIIDCVSQGGKLITCGAGASALVAKEIAGQAQETGLPVMVFTNDFAFAQPVSFAKGAFEDEYALAEYFGRAISSRDVVLGVSASGGTGFVFELLRIAKDKGAKTIAITENSDTPLGKNADIIIKSEGKPEGPSSSRVQVAHLVIGYALILTIADKRGIDAETAIKYMLHQECRNKKMGIK